MELAMDIANLPRKYPSSQETISPASSRCGEIYSFAVRVHRFKILDRRFRRCFSLQGSCTNRKPIWVQCQRDCRGGIARMMDDLFHLEARARFIINAVGQRFLRFFCSPPVARYREAIHPFPGKGPRSVCPKGCFDRSRILRNIS